MTFCCYMAVQFWLAAGEFCKVELLACGTGFIQSVKGYSRSGNEA